MIELEGAMLLATEASATLLPVSLEEVSETGALNIYAPVTNGLSEDILLDDSARGDDDGWITSLLSSTSPGALDAVMISPGGEILLDPQQNEEDIIITGKRPTGELDYYYETGGSGTGGTGSTGGGSGGSGAAGTAVATHAQDCGTEDGAAVQVARHVMGVLPAGVSGPEATLTTSTGNDWTAVEFGALIVRNPNGSFGAFNDKIYSSDKETYVLVPYNSTQPILGFWHTHPAGGDSQARQAINRYPSEFDWNVLGQIAGRSSSVSDPSLWVTGPDGVTREFKLSERGYFEAMAENESRMAAGEGLEGRERTQSCS